LPQRLTKQEVAAIGDMTGCERSEDAGREPSKQQFAGAEGGFAPDACFVC